MVKNAANIEKKKDSYKIRKIIGGGTVTSSLY